jgi:hypothetical protein
MPPTSTLRSSSSTPSTRPFAAILASTGSSSQCTRCLFFRPITFNSKKKTNLFDSTASLVVSLPPARSPAVSTRATATTRRLPVAARPGSATTPSSSTVTVKRSWCVVVHWVFRLGAELHFTGYRKKLGVSFSSCGKEGDSIYTDSLLQVYIYVKNSLLRRRDACSNLVVEYTGVRFRSIAEEIDIPCLSSRGRNHRGGSPHQMIHSLSHPE